MKTESGFKIIGKVRLVCRDKNGNILWDTGFIKNKITNVSFAVIAGLMGNTGSQVAFGYLAVGTSSSAESAASTALGAEVSNHGLARAAATVSRVTTTQTNDTLQLVYTWTASGGSSDTIQEIGIFNDATVGVMLGRKLTGSKTVNSGEQLTATYKVTVTGD